MLSLDTLKEKIWNSYLTLTQNRGCNFLSNKSFKDESLEKIMKDLKSVLIETNRYGRDVLETANQLIFKLLQEKHFLCENNNMSTFIGLLYLKEMGVSVKNYTLDGITDNSTIEEIRTVTAAW